MNTKGKVALITGAGSGMGRATAQALAAEGASVLVVDIDPEGGEETARLIKEAGGNATFFKADVSTPAGIRSMFDAVESTYGGVDIVHNNAGIPSGAPDWPEVSLERICQVVAINTSGVMMGTQAAVHAMRKRGGGVVINTASIAALGPSQNEPVYNGSKAAVLMFTQSCARLKETENVRVNAVLPAMVATKFQANTGDGKTPAAWLIPAMERIGDSILPPEAIAKVVLEFIHDDSLAGEYRVVRNEVPNPV
jgi:NAD(P)-dependent dehydrogenase (short-subunit alcohol dehydrogenase family)